MEYTTLGDTGLEVSRLCLGMMSYGDPEWRSWVLPEEEARPMVRAALEAGINFFDTADMYSRGGSEEVTGSLLGEMARRDEVVIATKVYFPMSDRPNRGGLGRKHVLDSVRDSLRRLDTDYIDLYQIHGYDPDTPWAETMRALDDLVRDGKVRYVGCSNLAVRHILRANHLAERYGWSNFVSLQAYYSLLGRDLEHELLPLCREEGIGVMVWSPLAGGFLTGKFRRGEEGPDEARRSEFDFPPIDKERGYDVVEVLDELAQEKGTTIPRLALAWLLHQEGISTVIIGARNMDQLEDNLGSAEVGFSDQDLERLDEVSASRRPYPQWMIDFQTGRVQPEE